MRIVESGVFGDLVDRFDPGAVADQLPNRRKELHVRLCSQRYHLPRIFLARARAIVIG